MKFINVIKGFEILRKYYNDPNGYYVGAEHDQIYCYSTDIPLTSDDVNQMYYLGWFQEFSLNVYNPKEGWSCYV